MAREFEKRRTFAIISHPDAGLLTAALPLTDPRIMVTEGAPALRATIDTPHGPRRIG